MEKREKFHICVFQKPARCKTSFFFFLNCWRKKKEQLFFPRKLFTVSWFGTLECILNLYHTEKIVWLG